MSPKKRTLAIRRHPQYERTRLAAEVAALPPVDATRPVTRGDCLEGPNAARPCPWVSCPYNLYLDVLEPSGSIRFRDPAQAPEDVSPGESCALDVADQGSHTASAVAKILDLTPERTRQIERRSLPVIRAALRALGEDGEP